MPHYQPPFRFMDLPAEVRTCIYRELLCNFIFESNALARILRERNSITSMNQALHPFHTSILRVNREICREAYDVMVKTNRFVYVSSIGLDMKRILVRHQVPIISMNRAHAQQFWDYMMYVYVETTERSRHKSSKDHFVCMYQAWYDMQECMTLMVTLVMILAHHWPDLCSAFNRQFYQPPHLSIDLAFPPPNRSVYISSLHPSFLQKSQDLFLGDTRRRLRGIKKVRVFGSNYPQLSCSVENDVMAPAMPVHPQWLSHADGWCHLAQNLQHQNRHIEAFGLWNEVRLTKTSILKQALPYLSYKHIRFTCAIGLALAYLHYLDFPPPAPLTEKQFNEMRNLADSEISEVRMRARSDGQRAQALILNCRLLRLTCLRREGYAVSAHLVRKMMVSLHRAEAFDQSDAMVVEERGALMLWRGRIDIVGSTEF
jgi:hypothetical protein